MNSRTNARWLFWEMNSNAEALTGPCVVRWSPGHEGKSQLALEVADRSHSRTSRRFFHS
jgi:hypothetical protein